MTRGRATADAAHRVPDRVIADKRRRWPDATIVLDGPYGLPPARWDEGSFELVARNLIWNAIKDGAEFGFRVPTFVETGDSLDID